MRKDKKKARAAKKKGKSKRIKKAASRFSHMPEIILALMALSIVAGFMTPSPWSVILLSVGILVCPFILYPLFLVYQKSGRKYGKQNSNQNQAEEPGWEAVNLMYGISRKDHYKDLPPEVREKSIFGKRD